MSTPIAPPVPDTRPAVDRRSGEGRPRDGAGRSESFEASLADADRALDPSRAEQVDPATGRPADATDGAGPAGPDAGAGVDEQQPGPDAVTADADADDPTDDPDDGRSAPQAEAAVLAAAGQVAPTAPPDDVPSTPAPGGSGEDVAAPPVASGGPPAATAPEGPPGAPVEVPDPVGSAGSGAGTLVVGGGESDPTAPTEVADLPGNEALDPPSPGPSTERAHVPGPTPDRADAVPTAPPVPAPSTIRPPAAGAGAPVTGAPGTSVPLDDLGPHLAGRLLRRDGATHLELQLHPAELGAVTVEVRLEDGLTHLHLRAAHGGTVERIDASLTELRDDLRRAGVAVGDLDVGAGDSRRPPERSPQDAGRSGTPPGAGAGRAPAPDAPTAPPTARPSGLDVRL